jgi:hypothetical protein
VDSGPHQGIGDSGSLHSSYWQTEKGVVKWGYVGVATFNGVPEVPHAISSVCFLAIPIVGKALVDGGESGYDRRDRNDREAR